MGKIWVNKAKSFEEAQQFETAYYRLQSVVERLESMQFLREMQFRNGRLSLGENGKRLRRVFRIIR